MATNRLSLTKIARLGDGRHVDGEGLILQITNNGAAKSWLFRWRDRRTGKDKYLGLGPLHTTDIHEARSLAEKCRKYLRDGKDPGIEFHGERFDQEHARGLAKTVNEVLDEYLNAKVLLDKRSEWTKISGRNRTKIIRETIGHMPIQKVDTKIILDTVGIRKMWSSKNPTAWKVLTHLRRMFSLAITNKYYVGDNPAAWKDHLENTLPHPGDMHRINHQASLHYNRVGHFLQELRAFQDRSVRARGHPTAALWLEFVVLTGCRISEARLATWDQMDLDTDTMVWTCPPELHKMGSVTEQAILRPITPPMVAVLEEMERRYPDHAKDAIIFPSDFMPPGIIVPYRPGSAAQFIRQNMKYPIKITPHGFRTTLHEWVRHYHPEWDNLWEIQVGHKVGDLTKQAYARDQLLEKRRPMMELWGEYCSKPAPEPSKAANVKSLAEHRRKKAS
jgi:integrase